MQVLIMFLICGVDGKLPRNQKYWYLNIEQALFDRNGNMLSMAGFAKKVAPAVVIFKRQVNV